MGLSGLVARLGNSDQVEGRHGSTAAWVRLAGPSGTPPAWSTTHSARRQEGPRRARRWIAGKIHSATRYHSMHRPERCTPRSPLVLALARVRVTVLRSGVVWRLTFRTGAILAWVLDHAHPFVVLSGLVSAGCRVRGVIASFEPIVDWSPDNLVPGTTGPLFAQLIHSSLGSWTCAAGRRGQACCEVICSVYFKLPGRPPARSVVSCESELRWRRWPLGGSGQGIRNPWA